MVPCQVLWRPCQEHCLNTHGTWVFPTYGPNRRPTATTRLPNLPSPNHHQSHNWSSLYTYLLLPMYRPPCTMGIKRLRSLLLELLFYWYDRQHNCSFQYGGKLCIPTLSKSVHSVLLHIVSPILCPLSRCHVTRCSGFLVDPLKKKGTNTILLDRGSPSKGDSSLLVRCRIRNPHKGPTTIS